MMKSMTGFGRAKLEKDAREYVVEIKSVNHKYSDINIKMPRNLLYLEDKIRKSILNKISRGKIDVFITYANFGIEGKKVVINNELAKAYIHELSKLAEETNIDGKIRVTEITKMPDILNLEDDEEMQDIIWQELSECINTAVDNLVEMRLQEGNKIKEDLRIRLSNIENNIEKIIEQSETIVKEYVVKLEQRIKDILKTDVVDQNRLAQEIVIYSDKCSVEEELTRLKSHISQFKSLIEKEGPIGKKIDFLIQEMNRETNTIGSKSGNVHITNLVIEMKTELEDVREQIQNIE